MKITLESSHKRFGFPFRLIGSAGRYDTLSDCAFIDESHIVCVDRQMAQLYLIRFDLSGSEYTILDTTTVVCDGVPQHFELISLCHTPTAIIIYSISYKNTLFSCTLINNKFGNFHTTVVNIDDAYHGVHAFGGDSVYVTNMVRPTITEYNIKTKSRKSIVCSEGVRMKDVFPIDEHHLLALSSDRGPIVNVTYNVPYDSHVFIYNRHTGAVTAKHTLKNTQIDSCVYNAPYCYVTCTNSDGSGYLFRSKIDGYTFSEPTSISCAGFPHGIAIYKNLIAYTSYTDSALYIHTLDKNGDISTK
jgi:hypothetical protein